MLHVGVSYISMSNVCFWRRCSSLVEVVYITVLRLKQDLAVRKCCIAFSIKNQWGGYFNYYSVVKVSQLRPFCIVFSFRGHWQALLSKRVHKILLLCCAWLLAAHTTQDKTILLICICHTSLINQRLFYGIVCFHWVQTDNLVSRGYCHKRLLLLPWYF